MESECQGTAWESRLEFRQLWEDVDIDVVLELGERYLQSVHPTPERTILMALLMRLRQIDQHRQAR